MFQQIQSKQFKRLEKAEAKLKRRLHKQYIADASLLADVVKLWYTSDDVSFSDMMRTVSTVDAIKLQNEVDDILQQNSDSYLVSEFPFNLQQREYRTLTNYQMMQAQIIIREVKSGFAEHKDIRQHLSNQITDCVSDIDDSLRLTEQDVDNIIDNQNYVDVIGKTLLASIICNRILQGHRESTIVKDCIVRKSSQSSAVDLVKKYAVKTATNNSNKIFFTQGTRVTHEADATALQKTTQDKVDKVVKPDTPINPVQPDQPKPKTDSSTVEKSKPETNPTGQIDKPKLPDEPVQPATQTPTTPVQDILLYYSKTAGDDNVCDRCIEVSLAQQQTPVLLEDMVAGVNAPPWHPYCRCGIEIVKDYVKE